MLIERYAECPPDWQRVIAALIELRKRGRFHALYVDSFEIRVRRNMWDVDLDRVTWQEARVMTAELEAQIATEEVKRKEVCSETGQLARERSGRAG